MQELSSVRGAAQLAQRQAQQQAEEQRLALEAELDRRSGAAAEAQRQLRVAHAQELHRLEVGACPATRSRRVDGWQPGARAQALAPCA